MHALWQEIRDMDRSRRALRSFGCLVGGVFVLVGGAIVWWKGLLLVPILLCSCGAILVILGLVAPAVLRVVHYAWMAMAMVMGFVMTRVLLAGVFYVLVTPLGLLMRLFGKDPMHRRRDPSADTYWRTRTDTPSSKDRLEKYY